MCPFPQAEEAEAFRAAVERRKSQMEDADAELARAAGSAAAKESSKDSKSGSKSKSKTASKKAAATHSDDEGGEEELFRAAVERRKSQMEDEDTELKKAVAAKAAKSSKSSKTASKAKAEKDDDEEELFKVRAQGGGGFPGALLSGGRGPLTPEDEQPLKRADRGGRGASFVCASFSQVGPGLSRWGHRGLSGAEPVGDFLCLFPPTPPSLVYLRRVFLLLLLFIFLPGGAGWQEKGALHTGA